MVGRPQKYPGKFRMPKAFPPWQPALVSAAYANAPAEATEICSRLASAWDAVHARYAIPLERNPSAPLAPEAAIKSAKRAGERLDKMLQVVTAEEIQRVLPETVRLSGQGAGEDVSESLGSQDSAEDDDEEDDEDDDDGEGATAAAAAAPKSATSKLVVRPAAGRLRRLATRIDSSDGSDDSASESEATPAPAKRARVGGAVSTAPKEIAQRARRLCANAVQALQQGQQQALETILVDLDAQLKELEID